MNDGPWDELICKACGHAGAGHNRTATVVNVLKGTSRSVTEGCTSCECDKYEPVPAAQEGFFAEWRGLGGSRAKPDFVAFLRVVKEGRWGPGPIYEIDTSGISPSGDPSGVRRDLVQAAKKAGLPIVVETSPKLRWVRFHFAGPNEKPTVR